MTSDWGLYTAAAIVAVAALLWAGGALSSMLVFGHVPRGHVLAGIVALAHPDRPSAAWRSPVGPAAVYWSCTAAVLTSTVASGWLAWRIARRLAPTARPERTEGLASRADVRAAASARSLVTRSAALRPSLERPRPRDIGYRLGTSRGIDCWASVEDSMLLVGPPRSGKGRNVVVPMILDAPGAVVTTSTRPDNVAITLSARRRLGPVVVFDPQGIAPSLGTVPPLRWSLVRGCESPLTAMLRAEALVPDGKSSGLESGTFWRQQALSATRSMLHAAALAGRPPADLYRWSHAAAGAKEAVAILASSPAATPGWERALDAVISAEQRTRDAVWAMVANTFSPLADPAVLAAISPDEGFDFDPLAFLAMRGTLFLLGTSTGAAPTASLVAALIEDVVEAGRRLAGCSPSQRLDPPLTLVLDEAANYPLPSLPSLMSEGGGSGISTLAALQSLSQARDRWGRDAAGAIWDAAIVKIVLGGSGSADDLADLARLIGEREVKEWSETSHADSSRRSVSASTRRRPILEPSEIRRLPVGTGLLLLRSSAPVMMRLCPWTSRADAASLIADREAFEQRTAPRA